MTPSQFLDRITDLIVEDLMETSDAEILREVMEDGERAEIEAVTVLIDEMIQGRKK